MLNEMIDALSFSYSENPELCTKYPGAWISGAVYKYNYIELATLLDELLPMIEDETFSFNDNFDGHNVFEEFVCILLFQLFQKHSIIHLDKNTAGIRVDKLKNIILSLNPT